MDTLFIDYDDSLIGRKKKLSSYNFYGAEATTANQKRALSCFRYVIEDILEWTPEEALKRMDSYMIQLMKLEDILKYIVWPIEVPVGDIRYLLSLLYPDDIPLNYRDMVLSIYQNVLNNVHQFPKNYFDGVKGMGRFCICLNYVVYHFRSFANLEEMYEFFNSRDGKRFLDAYALLVPFEQLGVDISECVYRLTKNTPYSKLYCRYHQFMNEFDQ